MGTLGMSTPPELSKAFSQLDEFAPGILSMDGVD